MCFRVFIPSCPGVCVYLFTYFILCYLFTYLFLLLSAYFSRHHFGVLFLPCHYSILSAYLFRHRFWWSILFTYSFFYLLLYFLSAYLFRHRFLWCFICIYLFIFQCGGYSPTHHGGSPRRSPIWTTVGLRRNIGVSITGKGANPSHPWMGGWGGSNILSPPPSLGAVARRHLEVGF